MESSAELLWQRLRQYSEYTHVETALINFETPNKSTILADIINVYEIGKIKFEMDIDIEINEYLIIKNYISHIRAQYLKCEHCGVSFQDLHCLELNHKEEHRFERGDKEKRFGLSSISEIVSWCVENKKWTSGEPMNQILEIIEEENTHVEGLCVACHRIYHDEDDTGEQKYRINILRNRKNALEEPDQKKLKRSLDQIMMDTTDLLPVGTGSYYPWTSQEESNLLRIVKEVGKPRDWPTVAKRLGTGRTAKAVEGHWQEMTSDERKQENNIKKDVVRRLGEGRVVLVPLGHAP